MSSGNSLLIVRMATPLRDPIDQFVDLGLGAHVDFPGLEGSAKGSRRLRRSSWRWLGVRSQNESHQSFWTAKFEDAVESTEAQNRR
jgi:hypothetical protein